MLVINLNNNRSQKKAWMRERCWEWWLIHTDSAFNVRPVFETLEAMAKAEFKIAIGCNSSATSPQGPPNK
jgi:hypothetical protein